MSSVNRRQPTRSVRTSTTRPSNYYARPLGYRGSISAIAEPEISSTAAAPGFFPAITHFADGLAALPKEVMPQLTLLKETEGKVYQPDQALIELVGAVNALPSLPRQASQLHSHPFLNFSYSNSINVSANASVIDGHVPGSLPANVDNYEPPSSQQEPVHEQLETRRILFRQLQEQLKVMTAVLDEKSFALNGANEALARQLGRLEKTIPFIEKEVSEEARLGSNTHWALPHMKEQRKPTTAPVNERSRRDIQAANSLAAAAAVVHENDIAATRSEARREAMQAKRNRNHNVGSDFDERPASKKIVGNAKIRKPQESAALFEPSKGVSNGATSTSHKRRRVEKSTSLERRASVVGANGKAAQKTEPAMAVTDRIGIEEANGKHAAQTMIVKKMWVVSRPISVTAARHLLTSSRQVAKKKAAAGPVRPGRGTFFIDPSTAPKPSGPSQPASHPSVARAQQDSIQSALPDPTRIRPSSVASTSKSSAHSSSNTNTNGNGMRVTTPELESVAATTGKSIGEARAGVQESYTNAGGEHTVEEANVHGAIAFVASGVASPMPTAAPTLKDEDNEPVTEAQNTDDVGQDGNGVLPSSILGSISMAVTRSRGGSRPTKAPTPFNPDNPQPAAPALVRSRSTRNASSAGIGAPSPAPAAPSPRRSHKKGAGAAALAAATAALNHVSAPPAATRSPVWTATESVVRPDPAGRRLSSLSPGRGPCPTRTTEPGPPTRMTAGFQDATSGRRGVIEEDVHAGVEAEAGAEMDENEPRYCICQGVSYGNMIACDNANCGREWFHLDCVGLSRLPGSKTKWYCDECKELLKRGRSGGTGSR